MGEEGETIDMYVAISLQHHVGHAIDEGRPLNEDALLKHTVCVRQLKLHFPQALCQQISELHEHHVLSIASPASIAHDQTHS